MNTNKAAVSASNVMLFNITKKHVWRNYDVNSESFKKMTLQEGYGAGETPEAGDEPGDVTAGASVLDTRSFTKKEQQAYEIKAPVYNNFLDLNNLYGHKVDKNFYKNHIKYYLPPIGSKKTEGKRMAKIYNRTNLAATGGNTTDLNQLAKGKRVSIANQDGGAKLPGLKKGKKTGAKGDYPSPNRSNKGSLPSTPRRVRSSGRRQSFSPRRVLRQKNVHVAEDQFPSLNNIYTNEQDFDRNKELFVLEHMKRSEQNRSPICRQTITQLSKQLGPKENNDVRNYLGMTAKEANVEEQGFDYEETDAPANSVDPGVSILRNNAETNYEKLFYSRLGVTSMSRTSSKSSSSLPNHQARMGSAQESSYCYVQPSGGQFETTQNATMLQNLRQTSKFNQKIWTCDILGERYCKNCIECHIRGFARIFEKKFSHNTDPLQIVTELMQDKLMNPKFIKKDLDDDDDEEEEDEDEAEERRDNLFDLKPSKPDVQAAKDEYYRQINKKIKQLLRVHG